MTSKVTTLALSSFHPSHFSSVIITHGRIFSLAMTMLRRDLTQTETTMKQKRRISQSPPTHFYNCLSYQSVSLSFRYIVFNPSLRQTVLNASNHHLIDVTSAMGIASIDNYSIPYDSIFVAFVAFRFFLSLSLCAPSTI